MSNPPQVNKPAHKKTVRGIHPAGADHRMYTDFQPEMENGSLIGRLRARNEWKFVNVLPQADRGLAAAWWILLLLRGLLPAGFAVATGVLVAAIQQGGSLAAPLALAGVVFVLLQV